MSDRAISPALFLLTMGLVVLAVLVGRSTGEPNRIAQEQSSDAASVLIPSPESTTDEIRQQSHAPQIVEPLSDGITSPPQPSRESVLSPTNTPPAYSASDLASSSNTTADETNTQLSASTQNDWNPPSLPVPLARHPFDHFWFIRPVASSYINHGLDWYGYGADGPNNDIRVHHGIDIANPVGIEVVAAADGSIEWAGRGHRNEFEDISVYGNTVVIRHDSGYDGKPIWTLYAHLSAILVQQGERVSAGDIIGLIGATGQVSGPHVHFEVRLENNEYYSVRNPDLWMAPYVGTGVIAGRVEYPDSTLANDADINIIDMSTSDIVFQATTYAGPGVNSDDQWQENFTIPDVETGQYLVTITKGIARWTGQITVREGMTNWVDLTYFKADATPTSPATATITPSAEP